VVVSFVASIVGGRPMILKAIAERLKRRSKDDFKGRHFEAFLILHAVSWYLRYRCHVVAAQGLWFRLHVNSGGAEPGACALFQTSADQ
jgi:hypothetical protein